MYIFGASGHGKVIASIILAQNEVEISSFLDDNPKHEELFGYQVQTSSVVKNYENIKLIIGVGDNLIRKKISQRLPSDYQIGIHPSAVIAPNCIIGKGTVVMPNVSINPDVTIGKHCIVNTSAVIEHDCILEDFVHVSPNAALAGEVYVAEGTHIGIGACVIQGVKIGKWATIGAGAVIIKDVPDYAVVVGNPGKIIRYHDH